MSSSVVEIVLHVWACGVEKGLVWGMGEDNSLLEMGQLIFNMGPDWIEVPTLH
jgi:hypothetical protein